MFQCYLTCLMITWIITYNKKRNAHHYKSNSKTIHNIYLLYGRHLSPKLHWWCILRLSNVFVVKSDDERRYHITYFYPFWVQAIWCHRSLSHQDTTSTKEVCNHKWVLWEARDRWNWLPLLWNICRRVWAFTQNYSSWYCFCCGQQLWLCSQY